MRAESGQRGHDRSQPVSRGETGFRLGPGRIGEAVGPPWRNLLKQGNVPFRGGEERGELPKEIAVQPHMLLAGDWASQHPPGETSRRHTGFLAVLRRRKVAAVEEVPAQDPEVQELRASEKISQTPTRADAISSSQAMVPRPVDHIFEAPAISRTTSPKDE